MNNRDNDNLPNTNLTETRNELIEKRLRNPEPSFYLPTCGVWCSRLSSLKESPIRCGSFHPNPGYEVGEWGFTAGFTQPQGYLTAMVASVECEL
jgi:hypothetical protein